MTSIAHIRVLTHRNDLRGKFWNPAIRWRTKYAIFIEITDEAGRTGLGECWCFDARPDALCAYLRTEVLPHFLGQPLSSLEEITQRLTRRATLTARHGMLASALSGVDIAVHDLCALAAGTPVYRMLDSAATGKVHLYGSGGLYGKDKGLPELANEMRQMAARGFSIVKMKVAGLLFEEDLKRVQAVLAAIPEGTKLIIDAVYSLSPDEALRFFEALPAERIEAFQSPTPAHDIAGMARLVRAGVPVMATEAEYRAEVHRQLVGEGAVRFLQTAPVACGGFTRLTELSELVADTPVRLSLEVSSTAVALMTACQFAAANGQVAHVEQHYLHQVFFDRLPWSGQQLSTSTALPDMPGLGITLPPDQTSQIFELSAASKEDALT